MIFIKTKVNITDNSGGKLGECIRVFGSKYENAFLSDSIVIAVKKAIAKKKVKLHDVRIGIIVRMGRKTYRQNGITINFSDNAVVLLDKRNDLAANRIFGPVASELITNKYNKIIFLAPSII